MKPKSMKTILLAALMAPGALFAQTTATTTPVGYETIALNSGFNYIGLRLHNPVLAAGTLDAVSATSATDNDVNLQQLVTASKTYLLEVKTASNNGAVSEVLGSSISGGIVNTSNDLVAAAVASGNSYILRESSTLASIFGLTNSAALSPGFGSSVGADVVNVPNSSGGFDAYYYDGDDTAWKNAAGNTIDPTLVPLVYLDAILLFSTAQKNLVVSGEIVKESKNHVLSSGFNYVGSIYPTATTLESSFGSNIGILNQGFGSSVGADVISVPNSSGSFDSYYYDGDDSVWKSTPMGDTVNPQSVNLTSGLLIFNAGTAKNFTNSPASFYSTL